ncbi:MAG: methyltransferase domain-containing protein [Proteobacteria bacterium]|nr:methyltransferase domain-containing protein [Pseudomonadota bacterium]
MNAASDLVDLQQTLYSSKNPTRQWLHCTRRDWIIDALRRYVHEKVDTTLEVGPGYGIYLPVLAQLSANVMATDIEDAYLNYAAGLRSVHPNISLQIDDITDSNLRDGSFDVILCTEVIEHIQESAAALREMHRLLKPGGVVVLSTPQRYSPLELAAKIAFVPGIINIVRLVYREPILESGHINLMTERQITAQLEAAGFRIRERFKSGVYLPVVAEFTGTLGLRLAQALESKLRDGPLSGLLWTQYYIAEAAHHGQKP